MDEVDDVIRAAVEIAGAIERRDIRALANALAPGFVQRTPGEAPRDAETFLKGVEDIPGDLVFVKLLGVEVDVSGAGALVTGIQHAQVRIDGKAIDDRRAFVDWFIKHDATWRICVAVDLPVA